MKDHLVIIDSHPTHHLQPFAAFLRHQFTCHSDTTIAWLVASAFAQRVGVQFSLTVAAAECRGEDLLERKGVEIVIEHCYVVIVMVYVCL